MRRPFVRRATALAASMTLVVSGLMVLAPAASAAPEDEKRRIDAQLEELGHELEGTSSELSGAYLELTSTQARLPQARAELTSAQQQAAEAEARDADLAVRLEVSRAEEALALAAVAQGAQEVDDTHVAVGRIARQAYTGQDMSGLAVALGAQSPDDFATRIVLVDSVMRAQNGALDRLQAQQADNRNRQVRLEAVREQVAGLKVAAEQSLAAARAARSAAAAVAAEIEQLVGDQQRLVAVVEERKAEEMARLAQLEREQRELAQLLERLAREAREKAAREKAAREEAAREEAAREEAAREEAAREEAAREEAAREEAAEAEGERVRLEQRQSGRAQRSRSKPAPREAAPQPPASSGDLFRPTTSRFTSRYGWRVHPIYKIRKLHAGTDFGGPCGIPVRAAEDGTVVRAGPAGGYGNQLVIDHGMARGVGLATSYNHLGSFAVTSGQVSRGQVIAYVGNTGASTGCHLHFEVFEDGRNVNPMTWL